DEQLVVAGPREPRRGRPVDPREAVAGPVRPRAGDLGALAAAEAPLRAVRDAGRAMPGDEGEGPALACHAAPAQAAGCTAGDSGALSPAGSGTGASCRHVGRTRSSSDPSGPPV